MLQHLLKRGAQIAKTYLFFWLKERAEKMLGRDKEAQAELDKAEVKIDNLNEVANTRDQKGVVEDLRTTLRMIRAQLGGSYSGVSNKAMVLSMASVLYFIMPIDMVPDFIPMSGLIDDLGLLVWLGATINSELDKFVEWERVTHKNDHIEEVEVVANKLEGNDRFGERATVK